MTSAYSYEARLLGGGAASLDDFRGRVLLVVNVASRCGFTPQYAGLEALYESYRDRGFEVLGFPCNQFLFQEPGDAARIRGFCSEKYGVTFPMFDKLKVRGRNAHPLFRHLSEHPDDEGKAGPVRWNFEKFLVDREGAVARRFRSRVEPQAQVLVTALESLLATPADPLSAKAPPL